MLATSIALVALAILGVLPLRMFLAFAVGGAAVAIVGYIDDRRGLAARTRLAVHFAAGAWALFCLGGAPPLQVGHEIISLGWPGHILALFGVVWTLNLFNFMDGIDGLAASQGVFIPCAAAAISILVGQAAATPAVALAFGAACAGFLWWNWPPAKIFMGDVGSGYLGYMIAVMALMAGRESPTAVWTWLVLGGVFFADATVTLIKRLSRGERVYEAHRTHAYQILARRWGSHRRVTVLAILINVLWLLPCAILGVYRPHWAGWLVLVALTPLIVGVLIAGVGRR